MYLIPKTELKSFMSANIDQTKKSVDITKVMRHSFFTN